MIAVDTNILVYAHRADSPFHSAAAARVRALCEGRAAWGLPWPCVHEFVAITTNPRIFKDPSPSAVARRQVSAWLAAPTTTPFGEGSGYWEILDGLLDRSRATGGRVHDARIAALCLFHGVERLWTADRDFGWFPELRTENPLSRAGD